ncbi:MAG TPA: hypothetical protein DEQ47_12285 [Solibacterales bacterium]|nr:hypothetical protein [Bryobacterales bacterium]
MMAAQAPGPFELAGDQRSAEEQAIVHRRAVEFETWRMVQRCNAFASAWNAFLAEYSAQGTLNVKKARAAVNAWRKIESALPR